ncbi:MAG: hypothetical protein R6X10_03080 [Desulfobacterales bacterium]
MNRLLSSFIVLSVPIFFLVNCSLAITNHELYRYFEDAERSFMTKDITSVQKHASDDFKYTATVTVDGEVRKYDLNRIDYMKNAEVLFNSEAKFNYYKIDVKEIVTEGQKAEVTTQVSSSYVLKGITNECVAKTKSHFEKIGNKLMVTKMHSAAKCRNTKE